ncbi:unnamed protein product, partial [marine sediment metagenome]
FNQRQRLDLSYNITNNTFNLDGLYISFSKNPVYTDNCKDVQLFITIHPLYKSDSWTLEIYAETFYNGKKYKSREFKIIPSACEPNWECSGWVCIDDDIMTRNCQDTNHCAYAYNKPIERTGCETISAAEQISISFKNLSEPKNPLRIIILILAVGILTTVFAISIRRYKFKRDRNL